MSVPARQMEIVVDPFNGESFTTYVEEYHAVEPSAYVWDPGWTVFDVRGMEYFVSESGSVYAQPGNDCIGEAPAIQADMDEREKEITDAGDEEGI